MLTTPWIARVLGPPCTLDDLIDRITARCRPAVWARVYPTAATMDMAQARGYIRARARLVVAREIQIAASYLAHVSPAQRQRVKQSVSERLVDKTLGEISLRRPARLTELRAA